MARAIIAAGVAVFGKGPEVGKVSQLVIPTRDGSVAGRLFRPQTDAHGLIVYLHGGGWVVGALDDYDALARNLVARSGFALLLVDYRLAPEHPFPAGLHDAQDAIAWARSSLVEFAGLPLVVAGDSAGANLAIVANLALKDTVKPALQVLFYPVTDMPARSGSYEAYGSTSYPLTARDMEWFLAQYAGQGAAPDPRIAPMLEPSLAGSPPSWIATAEYDVLRDEGEAYAERLLNEGIAVQARRYDGLAHGFARWMNLVDTSSQALDDAAAAISAVITNRTTSF
jgi:acetyl esterase